MVNVSVVVALPVFVAAVGVIVVVGVEVVLSVSRLVTVKATVLVDTGSFEAPPRRVVQPPKDLVESQSTEEEERAKTPYRS